ncbi:uncharacterized protein LOC104585191 [Brachypodium distachyon]|uniref:KIB1-4 beta-propeller domain-containing protein n=1 Tax=Brachypodium distachyon TaxID=15368 RepID=I1IUE4_BRADI|nr:uncharacterized protein LOC104585191 [Brachypodium distachyon]PNT65452.1 hypothetical protein BRADI_4g42680v3 [Brachypodium distachyon]|eukprot:XP_014757914.1 uncharacterized protein LOC104585191 [Brachypodium distachyon]
MATEAISSSSLWSDGLLPELAGLVLCRLPSLADRARFGAVCRRWSLAAQRQAPTLPPALPWICPFPRQVFQSFPDGESHNLGSSQPTASLLCCGLSENWLLFMNTGRCVHVQQPSRFLKNPLNGATIPLPHKFGPAYDVRSDLISIRKFIVSSDVDGLIVAMTQRGLTGLTPSHGRGGQHTACCRPGMSVWSIAANPGYEDIAFHHGIIYGVTRKGGLYAHNISEDRGTGEPVVSKAKQVIMSVTPAGLILP